MGIHYYQGACSSLSFLISWAFSELSRVFFPPASLLISGPANKIQIVIHPIFLSTTLLSDPLKPPYQVLKPWERSSVWIIVSISILIDLLAPRVIDRLTID